MKYSDEQRIKKIYESAIKLHEYILENNVKKLIYWKIAPCSGLLQRHYII